MPHFRYCTKMIREGGGIVFFFSFEWREALYFFLAPYLYFISLSFCDIYWKTLVVSIKILCDHKWLLLDGENNDYVSLSGIYFTLYVIISHVLWKEQRECLVNIAPHCSLCKRYCSIHIICLNSWLSWHNSGVVLISFCVKLRPQNKY